MDSRLKLDYNNAKVIQKTTSQKKPTEKRVTANKTCQFCGEPTKTIIGCKTCVNRFREFVHHGKIPYPGYEPAPWMWFYYIYRNKKRDAKFM